MNKSEKSKVVADKIMAQAELAKAAELLHEAEQQNLTDGQNEIEAILKKRNMQMFPQIVLRHGKQLEQIIFVPAQQTPSKSLQMPQVTDPAEENTE